MEDDAHDKFAPLTEDEIAASSTVGPEAPEREDGELVAPVPAGAPEPPHLHPKWGEPSARWVSRRQRRDAANRLSVRSAGRAQAIPALHALARREGPTVALEGPSGCKATLRGHEAKR